MPLGGGGGGSGGAGVVAKIYRAKPADGVTVTSTTLASFSTAWTISNVIVGGGQNVLCNVQVSFSKAANNDCLFAIFRGATQLGGTIIHANQGAGITLTLPAWITWIDENPGAGTYTYEVKACQFTSGTITAKQTILTTDAAGGGSIFVAQVYTP